MWDDKGRGACWDGRGAGRAEELVCWRGSTRGPDRLLLLMCVEIRRVDRAREVNSIDP